MSELNSNYIFVFDTETTGLSPSKDEIIQLSYILYDTLNGKIIYATKLEEDIVKINATKMSKGAFDSHGIEIERTFNKDPIKTHIDKFIGYCEQAKILVGHNLGFDIRMIIAQIEKIKEHSSQEEKDRYDAFIKKFKSIEQYCTMYNKEARQICIETQGTKNKKIKENKEVHEILFGEVVKGQLHNALVDICVTLRNYLMLTMEIDICKTIGLTGEENKPCDENITTVANNNEICCLIKPEKITDFSKTFETIVSGEEPLITSLEILPGDEIKETQIKIEKKIATEFVKKIKTNAIKNVLSRSNKIVPQDNQDIFCVEIDFRICTSILNKSRERRNDICARVVKKNSSCQYKSHTSSVDPLTIQKSDPLYKRVMKAATQQFIANKSKKIVPGIDDVISGGRKKNKNRRKNKTMKKNKIN